MLADLFPKIKTYPRGQLLKNLSSQLIYEYENLFAINEEPADFLGSYLEADTNLIFVEDKQIIKNNKISINAKVVTGTGELVWIVLFEEEKKHWDFKTLRAKKAQVADVLSNTFEKLETKEQNGQ